MEPFVILTILILNAIIAIWQARRCNADPLVLSAMFQWRSALHLVNLRVLGGTAQDSKAEKALDALKKLAPECAMVLRNGSWQSTLDRARSAGRFFAKKTSGKLTSISKEKRFLFGKLSIDGGCSIII